MIVLLTSVISGGFDTLTVIEVVGRGAIIKQVPRNLTSIKDLYGSFSTNVLIRPYIYVKEVYTEDSLYVELILPVSIDTNINIKAFHRWLNRTLKELERVLKRAEEEARENGGPSPQGALKTRKTPQTFTVRGESGGIRLSLPGGLKAEVWDANGRRVGTYRDSRFIPLAPGIYFVKVGGKIEKVIVR